MHANRPAAVLVFLLLCAGGASGLSQDDGPKRRRDGQSELDHPRAQRGTQRREGPGPPPGRGFGPPPFDRGFGGFEQRREATTEGGFLFIDGQYLAPPYEIRRTDEGVTVNDREVTSTVMRTGPGDRGRGPMRPTEPSQLTLIDLLQPLSQGSVVLAFTGQPLFVLDSGGTAYDLFNTLLKNGKPVKQVSLEERLPAEFDRKVWQEWLERFESSDDFRIRAMNLINTFDATEKQAAAEIAATQRLNQFAYPLTLGSMLVTVLAIGHLLGGRPHAGKSTIGTDTSPEMVRALNWSLAFVALLSLLDLVWTILAGQADQIRELNPLGSHLIKDPRHLAGFKIGATLPALGLLWLLRRHKRAQIAAWWVCLILTLVTVRWLVWNSMLISA